jgi:hypothetical protein
MLSYKVQTHITQSFLKSWQSLSCSRNSLPFMKNKGPSVCSKKPAMKKIHKEYMRVLTTVYNTQNHGV